MENLSFLQVLSIIAVLAFSLLGPAILLYKFINHIKDAVNDKREKEALENRLLEIIEEQRAGNFDNLDERRFIERRLDYFHHPFLLY